MATVYAVTTDSWRRLTDSLNWANARGTALTSSADGSSSQTTYNFSIYNAYSGGRGGNTFYCSRTFFEFDVSGESGTATSASFKVYVDNLGTDATNESTIYVVSATAMADGHADYGNVFTISTTIGTLFGSGEATTTDGYLDISLNSAGLSALNSAIGSGRFTIGCMGYYDYNNTAPSLGGNTAQIKFTFSDYSGTSRDPNLDISYATATVDDAVFFGANF